MANAGISGAGIAVATGGMLLIYSGIRNVSPLQALRMVTTGALPAGNATAQDAQGPALQAAQADLIAAAVNPFASTAAYGGGGGLPTLPAALQAFSGDRYSQWHRWDAGYSDCSSFIGKGLKAIGIRPPGGSTTWDYLRSSAWYQIPESSAGAGDLAVNATHMVCVTGPGMAVGQENPRRNVVAGSIADLMSGTGSYVILRYRGSATVTGGGSSAAAVPHQGVVSV